MSSLSKLHAKLNAQVDALNVDQDIGGALRLLISCIDERGYLTPLDEIASFHSASYSLESLENALGILQYFSPPGIAGRDLQECLLLQVRTGNSLCRPLQLLIMNHLSDIQRGRLDTIASETGLSIAIVKKSIEILKHFSPRPGYLLSVD